MPIRVLLVEDGTSLEALAQLLTEDGFEVSTARDGVEALERLAEHCPNLIITDLRMPRMDGLELLSKLREENEPAPPVIVVSAREHQKQEALRAGAREFLTKPIDYAALLRTAYGFV